jgi:hypothetical protein
MARQRSAALLLLLLVVVASLAAAATVAGAAPETACVLTLPIDAKKSPFTLSGQVTKPFNATVTPVKATATGSVHLRLDTPGGACPPAADWADADAAAALLSRARLVQPTSARSGGVELLPEKIRASVASADSGNELATYTLTQFTFGLEGNAPFGGAVAEPVASSPSAVSAGGSTDAEVVVLKGGLVIDSPLTGERTADLAGVAQNVTVASGAAPVAAAAGAGGKAAPARVGVKLSDVKWSLAVSPKATPGIHFSEAKVGIAGEIVASTAGDPAAAAKEVPLSELRLRCKPRALGPIIEGGDDKKADLLKRQVRVSGGCPDGGGGGGGKAAVAAGAAAGASVADAAAAGAAPSAAGESEVDKAVREAYAKSGAAMVSLPSSSFAAAVAVAVAAAAVAW